MTDTTPVYGFPLPSDASRISALPWHLRALSRTLEDKLPSALQAAAGAAMDAAAASAQTAKEIADKLAADSRLFVKASGSVNLYWPGLDKIDQYATGGGPTASTPLSSYRLLAPVATSGDEPFTATAARRWDAFDAAGVRVGGAVLSPQQAPFTFTTPESATSFTISYNYSSVAPDAFMLVRGTTLPASYVPPGGDVDLRPYTVLGVPSAADVTRIAEGVSATAIRAVPSPNLYNYRTDTLDAFASGANPDAYDPLPGYRKSAPMPVTAGPYRGFCRRWDAFSAAGVRVAGGNSTPQGVKEINVPADGTQLVISYDGRTVDPSSVMVVAGTAYPATVKPYGAREVDFAGMNVVNLDLGATDADPASISARRTGSSLALTTALDNGAQLVLSADLASGGNGVFGHVSATVDGVTVHPDSDGTAPIRTQHGTLAAGHGWAMLHTWPASAHTLTTADLGSVWTDGLRTFILLAVQGGVAFLGAETTRAASGEDLVQSADLAGDLTRTDGAAGTLLKADRAPIAVNQMYPAVGRVRQSVLVDGVPLRPDETRQGGTVEVRESCELLDYTDLLRVARANPGKSYASLQVIGAVRIETVHRYRPGGSCSITTSLTEMLPTRLAACGMVQAGPMAGNTVAGTVKRVVPGVKGWTAGVDLTAHSTTKNVSTADLVRPGVPPLMTLDVRSDSAFALGVHPWRPGASSAAARLAEAPGNLWDLRATDKTYPTVILSEAPGWGRIEAHAYRSYLSPAQAQQIIAVADDAMAAHSALEFGGTLA